MNDEGKIRQKALPIEEKQKALVPTMLVQLKSGSLCPSHHSQVLPLHFVAPLRSVALELGWVLGVGLGVRVDGVGGPGVGHAQGLAPDDEAQEVQGKRLVVPACLEL